jgi:hypothetical protein
MRAFHELLFDDVVAGPGTFYSSSDFDVLLGTADALGIMVVADAATVMGDVSVYLESSADGRHFRDVAGRLASARVAPLGKATLATGWAPAVRAAFSGWLARLRLDFTGSGGVHLKVWVTGRVARAESGLAAASALQWARVARGEVLPEPPPVLASAASEPPMSGGGGKLLSPHWLVHPPGTPTWAYTALLGRHQGSALLAGPALPSTLLFADYVPGGQTYLWPRSALGGLPWFSLAGTEIEVLSTSPRVELEVHAVDPLELDLALRSIPLEDGTFQATFDALTGSAGALPRSASQAVPEGSLYVGSLAEPFAPFAPSPSQAIASPTVASLFGTMLGVEPPQGLAVAPWGGAAVQALRLVDHGACAFRVPLDGTGADGQPPLPEEVVTGLAGALQVPALPMLMGFGYVTVPFALDLRFARAWTRLSVGGGGFGVAAEIHVDPQAPLWSCFPSIFGLLCFPFDPAPLRVRLWRTYDLTLDGQGELMLAPVDGVLHTDFLDATDLSYKHFSLDVVAEWALIDQVDQRAAAQVPRGMHHVPIEALRGGAPDCLPENNVPRTVEWFVNDIRWLRDQVRAGTLAGPGVPPSDDAFWQAVETTASAPGNWSCRVPDPLFGIVDGADVPYASFRVPARRLNVYPDAIEVVWFDEHDPANPAYVLYLWAQSLELRFPGNGIMERFCSTPHVARRRFLTAGLG